MFPIITVAVGEVLGDVTEERVQIRVKRRAGRRTAIAEAKPAGTCAGPSSESPIREVLTGEQAQAVRHACDRHARTVEMSAGKAKVLANAVLGSLTYGPGGD